MIPVSQLLPRVLTDVLRNAPLTPEKVEFAWRSAVGSAVDKATSVHLAGQVLHVRVRDATWQREIERSARLIRSRLDTLLGPDVVRYIDVSVASVSP